MLLFRDKVVIGLTGGIASGKSTALGFFIKLGWATISTDQIVTDLLTNDEDLISSLVKRWGHAKLFSRGSIDKSKIAGIIFNDSTERVWLENLIHPLVRKSWVDSVFHSASSHHVVEIPLLFEKKLNAYFHKTISVYAPRELQKKRLLERGLDLEEAQARIDSQMCSERKATESNYVLLGSGPPKFLFEQVNRFHQLIKHNFS